MATRSSYKEWWPKDRRVDTPGRRGRPVFVSTKRDIPSQESSGWVAGACRSKQSDPWWRKPLWYEYAQDAAQGDREYPPSKERVREGDEEPVRRTTWEDLSGV